ncbi:probable flap endonuclease 1 homolog isoform X1 [Salminus brasiliensis]|uniref:probable flap endonuclease 1 homolog isoform X1 n=1 Tax=Salminus brasiliensis TaxID=930266 RepID=UPI003B833053
MMGITKLADLIRGSAPGAVSHREIGDYIGKVIALDTSIIVNQFRSAVPSLQLSPLLGLFFRTLTFLEHDIKPVFVFDGKPPSQKRAVLEKRAQSAGWNSSHRSDTGECRTGSVLNKRTAQLLFSERIYSQPALLPSAHVDHYNSRVSTKTQEFLRLLQLMGVPYIMAPADGEALCANLVRSGVAHAVASEDMDTLAFGGTILLRQLNAKRVSEVTEYSLPKLLDTLQLTQKEFVDLCILLGCDYCDKIAGLGPTRALKLIQQHRTIEDVLQNINRKTHSVPLGWQYQAARRLFLEAPQAGTSELAWSDPDEEGLVKFLCVEKHVKEERVRGRMEKFRQNLSKQRKQREEEKREGRTRQSRMDEFLRVTRKRSSADAVLSDSEKRAKTK